MALSECHQKLFCCHVSLVEQQCQVFPQAPIYLVLGSWPLQQCEVWAQFHEVGLQSSQKLVGYSSNICVTVEPVCLATQSLLQVTGLVAGRYRGLPFPLLSLQSTFLYHQHQSIEVKLIVRHYQLYCPCSVTYVLFSAIGPYRWLLRVTSRLGNSL